MTDLTLGAPPPAAAAPATKPTQRINWSVLLILATIVAAITAGLVLAAYGLVRYEESSRATVTPARTGTCSASAVAAYPDGRNGVAVIVHAPGPDLVQVDVQGFDHQRLIQQVSRGYDGAQFDFGRSFPRGDVTIHSKSFGTCTVAAPVLGRMLQRRI